MNVQLINLVTMMAAKRPGRPTKKDSRDAKQAIVNAARSIIEESGLHSLTIRAVAERAGVGTALVNYYFTNKQGLKEAIAVEAAAEVQELIQIILVPEGNPAEMIQQAVRQFVMSIGERPYITRLVMDLVLAGDEEVLRRLVTNVALPNLTMLKEVLESAKGKVEFPGADLRLILPAIAGAAFYPSVMAPLLLALTGLDLGAKDDLELYAEHTARLFVNGLKHSGGTK